MTNPILGCPQISELTLYLQGSLDKRRRDAVSQHLRLCANCDLKLAAMERQLSNANSNETTECPLAPMEVSRAEPIGAKASAGKRNTVGESESNSGAQSIGSSIDTVGSFAPEWSTGDLDPAVADRLVDDEEPPIAGDISIPGYRNFQYLGSGGMGVVFRAEQSVPERTVAIKILVSPIAHSTRRARFRREAELAARLEHPRIVQIYEVGEVQTQPYFSMRYLKGLDLATQVFRRGPFEPREAAVLMAKVADAIAYAHSNGVIHRDIKPLNIMIEPGGEPVVTDFGLARLLEDDGTTNHGQILGTPCYMAPEQALGQKVDVAADIYALGATLYFIITGRPPHQAASCAETIRQVIKDEALPVRSLNPACPRVLETIVMKCLEKEARSRYESAEDLAADLRRFLAGQPIAGRPISVGQRAKRWIVQHPWKSIIGGLLIAASILAPIVFAEMARARRDAEVERRLRRDILRLMTTSPAHAATTMNDLVDDFEPSDLRGELRRHLSDGELTEEMKTRLRIVGIKSGETAYVDPVMKFAISEDRISAHEFELIRTALKPYIDPMTERLWRDIESTRGNQFIRICALLAADSPLDQRWEAYEVRLATMLTKTKPPNATAWSRAFTQLGDRLAEPLLPIFSERRDEPEGLQAARFLAVFAANDVELLAQLVSDANAEQFKYVLPSYAKLPSKVHRPALLNLVAESQETTSRPADDLVRDQIRDALAMRRAGAAVTLLRLGDSSGIQRLMQVEGNYEALSQSVHMQRDRGITPRKLASCLREVASIEESISRESSESSNAPHTTDATLFGLILALGEHPLDSYERRDRQYIEALLVDLYERDARSSVHGAAGWLMQLWGDESTGLRSAKERVDSTPQAYRGDREWFVVKLGTEDDAPCLTFIVFGPGKPFPYRQDGREAIRTTRSFALSSHEITRSTFEYFLEDQDDVDPAKWKATVELDRWSPLPDCPVMGMSWDSSVVFCRWATRRMGNGAEQCYEPWEKPLVVEGEELRWSSDVRHGGIRLPTSAEWLLAAHSGTYTDFSYGSSLELFGEFGWDHNALHAMPVGQKKPHPRGLFDIHGNADEWCHDTDFNDRMLQQPVDFVGGDDWAWRALRGGGWDSRKTDCVSTFMHNDRPSSRSRQYGFRVAITLDN